MTRHEGMRGSTAYQDSVQLPAEKRQEDQQTARQEDQDGIAHRREEGFRGAAFLQDGRKRFAFWRRWHGGILTGRGL